MMTLTPAYGRDYKSKKAVLEDWNAKKDFTINDISSKWNGMVCNSDDLGAKPGVKFRYDRLTKVFVY